ncbi:hypothetical protein LCGC14_0237570 [marine sediment metagenome]|jgi:hypothetical protein|uniref:Uncharacterized protein n=1 Tax=marine sediment metagenome TaxID=412755 RepID=A0A0F9U8S4_9ZZZZ|nr:hypothetical protein [Halopseudomonas aestusnigri]MCK5529917.1 hypothetical protein [Halopseudomonas aestusnigri]MDL2200891.1 hypothetical protein [Halopseudomonas aestusnigri]UGV30044.1 hypothetical protein LO767_13750 [Halopseudomonas aestusnigri]|tara:strand:- start:540 stop:1190 length:651 start_codon:yes stop_codon:yes gene_type:complete
MRQVLECTADAVSSNLDPMKARQRKVVENIRELSANFTLRQVASIHRISMPSLQELAEQNDITFLDTSGTRSKRISSELIARERSHVAALVHRSIVTRKPVTSLDSDKISPALAELARRRDNEETNAFIDHLRELGKTNTRAQAAKLAGISPFFMRTLAYEHELEFTDDTVVPDGFADHDNVAKLSKSLFRVTRSLPANTLQLMQRFMLSDAPDEL